jgi:hypothetical protein
MSMVCSRAFDTTLRLAGIDSAMQFCPEWFHFLGTIDLILERPGTVSG